jgi:hypothetical protein
MSDRWKITEPEIRIVVRCQQDENHAKTVRFPASFGMENVQTFAGLLDGSSPFYKFPPGAGSPIGKCAICGGKLHCLIKEINPDAEP